MLFAKQFILNFTFLSIFDLFIFLPSIKHLMRLLYHETLLTWRYTTPHPNKTNQHITHTECTFDELLAYHTGHSSLHNLWKFCSKVYICKSKVLRCSPRCVTSCFGCYSLLGLMLALSQSGEELVDSDLWEMHLYFPIILPPHALSATRQLQLSIRNYTQQSF